MVRITGDELTQFLSGGIEDDELLGFGGDDRLDGGPGNDTLDGGPGNDSFAIEPGADTYIGGPDLDTLDLDPFRNPDPAPDYLVHLAAGEMDGGDLTGDRISGIEVVRSDSGNDTLIGDAADNLLDGREGDDDIDGGPGNDTLLSSGGRAFLDGGEGDDSLFSGDRALAGNIEGGPGNDTIGGVTGPGLFLDAGPDDDSVTLGAPTGDSGAGPVPLADGGRILLGGGNDTLSATGAPDVIKGGGGNDDIFVRNAYGGAPLILAGNGQDTIEIGGNGTVFASDDTGQIVNPTVNAGGNDDVILLDTRQATLIGGRGHDRVEVDTGGTLFDFRAEIDLIAGRIEWFAKRIEGGEILWDPAETTALRGIEQVNAITLERGTKRKDTFAATDSGAHYDGGKNFDTVDYSATAESVTADLVTGGAAGAALFDLYVGIEGLIGGQGDDSLAGDDKRNAFEGGAGADSIDGRGGAKDSASYATSPEAVIVSLDGSPGIGGDAEGDILAGIEILIGSDNDDQLSAGATAATLKGGEGDDTLFGSEGDDRLEGGPDTDTLIGGPGADTLDGGPGANDIADYQFTATDIQANLETRRGISGDAEGDVYRRIEGLGGGEGRDFLVGDKGANRLLGRGDEDTLIGGAGADTLDGGDGLDTASYVGSKQGVRVDLQTGTGEHGHAEGDTLIGIEALIGTDKGDTLSGADGLTQLDGRGGDDVLISKGGLDSLTGGRGFDTFKFVPTGVPLAATVTDFNRGQDQIDFSATGAENRLDIDYEERGDDMLFTVEGLAGFSVLVQNFQTSDLMGGGLFIWA